MPMPIRELILAAAPLASLFATPLSAAAQAPLAFPAPATESALPQTTLTPGVVQLLTLDGEFSQSVAKGGGAAFASWFAEDAVTLNNGKVPILGKAHIGATARWKPDEYQLVWLPMGAQMGPSGDMGFTWGHYDSTSKDKNGNAVTLSGRYITMWKRMPDGKWKVALDASAQEPAGTEQPPAAAQPAGTISPPAKP